MSQHDVMAQLLMESLMASTGSPRGAAHDDPVAQLFVHQQPQQQHPPTLCTLQQQQQQLPDGSSSSSAVFVMALAHRVSLLEQRLASLQATNDRLLLAMCLRDRGASPSAPSPPTQPAQQPQKDAAETAETAEQPLTSPVSDARPIAMGRWGAV
jgi:hypothetical protein